MSRCIQFTDTLIDLLEAINGELAELRGIRSGIFLPKGPVTIPLASSRTTRNLAKKANIPIVGRCALFIINSEQDLPRVFMDVRNFSSELNSIKRILTSKLLQALGSWAPADSTITGFTMASDFSEGESIGGVFDRNIPLTPSFLEALHLLNDVFSEWAPSKFGIFAPAGPFTVVLRMSTPARVIAHSIGIPSWDLCDVLFISGEEGARAALGLLQQLSAHITAMIEAIPPKMREETQDVEK